MSTAQRQSSIEISSNGPPTATPAEIKEPTATPTAVAQATTTPTPAPATSTPEPPTVTPTPEPVWQADGVIGEDEYAHQAAGAGVTFYWTNDADHLYGALFAPTQGWVAVGFDPQTRMQGANFVFAYVQGGQTSIQDMFGTRPQGPGSHPPDEQLGGQNNILEYGGQEADGSTIVEFKIPLDSGDEYDKPLLPGSSYTVILAYGSSDDFDSYHVDRGYAEIGLD